jgi:hypothetical protein
MTQQSTEGFPKTVLFPLAAIPVDRLRGLPLTAFSLRNTLCQRDPCPFTTGHGTCSSRLPQSAALKPAPPGGAISPSHGRPGHCPALGMVWAKHPGRPSFRSFSISTGPASRPAAHSLTQLYLLRFILLLNCWSLVLPLPRRTLLCDGHSIQLRVSSSLPHSFGTTHGQQPYPNLAETCASRRTSGQSPGAFHSWRPGAAGDRNRRSLLVRRWQSLVFGSTIGSPRCCS